MKKNLIITACIFLVSLMALTGFAQPDVQGYSKGGTSLQASNNYVVFPPFNTGQQQVTFLNCTGTNAAATLKFYTVGNPYVVSGGNTTNAWLTNPSGTEIGVGAVIIFWDASAGTYVQRITDYVTATNVGWSTSSPVLAAAPAAGDLVWLATAEASYVVGAATKEFVGSPIWVGQEGKPLLIALRDDTGNSGTAGCKLNLVTVILKKSVP